MNPKTLTFHADLCALSHRYLVEGLQKLSLSRLKTKLAIMAVKDSNVDDMLDLIYFVYNEDGVCDIPELQEAVVLCAVSRKGFLGADERLILMMKEDGRVGADHWRQVCEGFHSGPYEDVNWVDHDACW